MSRFKIVFIHFISVAMVCIAGIALCTALGFAVNAREMIKAMVICLAAAELAMIPIFVVRNKPAENAVQGALISMVIHLLASAGLSVILMQTSHPAKAFVYWLCAFYWASLAGVCRVLLQTVKSAPVSAVRSQNSAGPVGAGQASEV